MRGGVLNGATYAFSWLDESNPLARIDVLEMVTTDTTTLDAELSYWQHNGNTPHYSLEQVTVQRYPAWWIYTQAAPDVTQPTGILYPSTTIAVHLQQPVTIATWYTDGSLGGIPEKRLALHYWNNSRWLEIPTVVETAYNRVAAQMQQFTTYALLGRKDYIYLPVVLRSWGAQ